MSTIDHEYLEFGGFKIETQNHGKPQCPEITINEIDHSTTRPQAWSYKGDGYIHWFYNFAGAERESLFLGRKVPSRENWISIIESVPGTLLDKINILNIPLSGYHPESEKFFGNGIYANLWSSTEGSERQSGLSGYYLSLSINDSDMEEGSEFTRKYGPHLIRHTSYSSGLSLRFLLEKPTEKYPREIL